MQVYLQHDLEREVPPSPSRVQHHSKPSLHAELPARPENSQVLRIRARQPQLSAKFPPENLNHQHQANNKPTWLQRGFCWANHRGRGVLPVQYLLEPQLPPILPQRAGTLNPIQKFHICRRVGIIETLSNHNNQSQYEREILFEIIREEFLQ